MQQENNSFSKENTYLAVERNLLALERTLLAWIRTGIAGVAGGFALLRIIEFRLFIHHTAALIIGILCVLWGLAIFILSEYEYEEGCRRLKNIEPSLVLPLNRTRLLVSVLVLISVCVLYLGISK